MTRSAAPEVRGRKKLSTRSRRIIGMLFALAALVYLGYMVVGDAHEFKAALLSYSPWQLAIGIAFAISMFLLKALYHVLLCERLSAKSDLAAEVLPAYCTAQVVRYLPGKVWGIVYQANRLSQRLHAGEVVTANAIQTITTNVLGIGIIVSILTSAYLGKSWPLIGIIAAVVITEFIHRTPVIEAKLLQLAARFSRRQPRLPARVPPHRTVGTLILVLEWIAYFAIWFTVVGDKLGTTETITLAIWYAAASLLAIVAIAVPAGLAVREAIFVALGTFTSLAGAALVGYAAALRLILTVAEVGCIPIAELVRKGLVRGRR